MPPRRKKSSVKTTTRLVTVVGANPPRPRRRAPLPPNTPLNQFLKSALNPFMNSTPALGYNSFAATGLESLWTRDVGIPMGSTSTCAAVVFNPSTVGAGSGFIGSSGSGYLTVCSAADPSGLLAGTSVTYRSSPVNAVKFLAMADTFRSVTAGVRLTIRYPMTSAPGRLFALTMFDSETLLSASSYTGLAALGNTIPVVSDGSGVASVQCNWRQMDRTAFDFQIPNFIGVAGTNASKCVVVALGWPAGFSVDIDSIAHVEYNSGALPGSDSNDLNTVALSTPIERLGALVRRVPIVLSKTDLITCNLRALTAARDRHVGYRLSSAGAASASSGESTGLRTSFTESVVNGLSTDAGDYFDVAAEALRERAQGAASNFAYNSLAMGAAAAATLMNRRAQGQLMAGG